MNIHSLQSAAAAPPPAPAMARNRNARAAVMEELRRLLPGMTGVRQSLPFSLAALDSHLPQGGLACGALHEFVPAPRGIPAAFGFIVAILARLLHSPHFHSPPPHSPPPCGEGSGVGVERFCKTVDVPPLPHDPPAYPPPQGGRIFFILPAYGFRDYGRLHGRGLHALGLDPAHLIVVETRHRKETLWAIEEALHSGAPAAIAGFVDQLDLKSSQRLHLAAMEAGLPLFLLRQTPSSTAGWEGASAAATRWRVGAAEAARDRFGLIARPRWHLQLERVRNGRPGEWIVEYDHVAHRFSLAAALADPALSRSAGQANEKPCATAHRS